METPHQIALGLTTLVIAVVVTSPLANVFLSVMPTGTSRFTGTLEAGTFIAVWWTSYLLAIRVVRKRRARKQPADRNREEMD